MASAFAGPVGWKLPLLGDWLAVSPVELGLLEVSWELRMHCGSLLVWWYDRVSGVAVTVYPRGAEVSSSVFVVMQEAWCEACSGEADLRIQAAQVLTWWESQAVTQRLSTAFVVPLAGG